MTAAPDLRGPAIVLSPGAFRTPNGKTAHGLVRGSERFSVLAVVDAEAAGADAGEALDGRARGIPIVATLAEALAGPGKDARICVVGVATHGGRLPPELRALLRQAIDAGLDVVSGLHEYAGDDPDLAAAAARKGVSVFDVRRPRPKAELHFWTGAIADVRAARVAVLGTDCALGKRTTARLLTEACRRAGLAAEMIYTGQTGWMQGSRYGFVLDSTVNDFVSGELEHAVVTCDREARPDVVFIEGQSALRNPSGPCGAELIVSAQARGVILQHAPGRRDFDGHDGWPIPPLEDEVRLIGMYGARVLAITLNGEGLPPEGLRAARAAIAAKLGIPVALPIADGVDELVPVVRALVDDERVRRRI